MTGCEGAEVWLGVAGCEQRKYGPVWQAVKGGSMIQCDKLREYSFSIMGGTMRLHTF